MYKNKRYKTKSAKRRRQIAITRFILILLLLAIVALAVYFIVKGLNKKNDDTEEQTDIISSEELVEDDNGTAIQINDNLDENDVTQSITDLFNETDQNSDDLSLEQKLEIIDTSDAYPKDMVEFAHKYDQVIDYVYEYPEYKGKTFDTDVSNDVTSYGVPLLLQWDYRWGYSSYGDGLIGYTGCGPTCLSMVAIYLTGNLEYTPLYMADFATENGYSVEGVGTSWTLISEGTDLLGLSAKELPLWESNIKDELDNDHPVIVAVKEGDFTYSGHYIVLTGYNENGFTVNDPNSKENSEKTWSYDKLSPQIKNLWAISKK